MALADPSRTRPAISLTKAAHAAFVPTGMVTVLLGPLLPTLSARWSLNYAQAGSLFTAQFAGATLGTSLSGVIVARWGFRFAMAAGLLAMAVGVAALPFSSHLMGLACIFCYGGGIGVAIPAGNLLVAAINPERRSAALSLLNFSWSLGAVACPFVVAAVVRTESIQLLLLPLAGFLLLVLLWIAATPAYRVEPASMRDVECSRVSGADWNSRSLFILAGLFFLYVGVENAFGGWVASYAKSLGTGSLTVAVMTPSFFYGAVMIGRWVAPLALMKLDEIKAVRAGLSIACMGMIGLILARSLPFVASSAAVAGFGLAAVYPITISMLSQEFGTAASRVGSVMFTVANFGGALLPWAVGYVSHKFNTLAVGLVVPLAATVLMYVLYHGKWASKAIRPQPS
jgi:MFS transporter, FHS family, glucose/mannose:H+ symporter